MHALISSCLDTTKTTLEIVTQEKGQLSNTVREQEIEIKRLKQELSDEQDKSAITGDVSVLPNDGTDCVYVYSARHYRIIPIQSVYLHMGKCNHL